MWWEATLRGRLFFNRCAPGMVWSSFPGLFILSAYLPVSMGRSYWYECAKCGYRAKVAGRADRGVHFHVQTVVCRDCKQLFDAITRLRVSPAAARSLPAGQRRLPALAGNGKTQATHFQPPPMQQAVNRLFLQAAWSQWQTYRLQCPNSPTHRVQPWNDPDKCPRCGVFLERSALPYQVWE